MKSLLILGITGLSGGFLIAGGVIALIVGLGIVTRFVGITHTASENHLYETMILLGGLYGNMVTVYHMTIPFGRPGLIVLGIASGIYVGGWIMALAEVVHIFPIFARRIGLTKGVSWVVISIALGKFFGALLHFYMGW